MRQVSIPKNFVEALNSIFDQHPEAVAELMAARATTIDPEAARIAREQAIVDEAAGVGHVGGTPSRTLGLLDIINAALDSVAPGKRIATIHGPDGFDGFVLGRDKKPAPSPAEA